MELRAGRKAGDERLHYSNGDADFELLDFWLRCFGVFY